MPLHVVQRYMGHVTPAMTMEYAETLAETHEREFLRYRKITPTRVSCRVIGGAKWGRG